MVTPLTRVAASVRVRGLRVGRIDGLCGNRHWDSNTGDVGHVVKVRTCQGEDI